MKVFRVLFRPVIGLFCVLITAFISGCATTTKIPADSATLQPPAAPALPPAEQKPTEPVVPEKPVPVAPTRPAPTTPTSTPAESKTATAATIPPAKVQHATIIGSQESSILLDNFTAFVTAIDERKVPAGRNGWNVPLEIETGRRTLNVEFNRGVFFARGRLEFDAAANVRYELKFATDAELFGNNSYCNFWVVDAATGTTVSLISKDSVKKIAEAKTR